MLEYIKGVELFDAVREIGVISPHLCQYFVAAILVSIEYLHKNLIIYRDLKPENLMLTYSGHLKLIDMGTAKFLKSSSAKTFTMIGTPHYMAPETISGMGYSFSSDLWSIGVCFYEFLSGKVPFGEDIEDPFEIYKIIIKTNKIDFPNTLKD